MEPKGYEVANRGMSEYIDSMNSMKKNPFSVRLHTGNLKKMP